MMRMPSSRVVSPLLLLLFAFTTGATLGASPADALWRFNTHG